MPKQVDHDARRRELAEAACAVVARDGVDGASLRSVAAQAGWSVGSMQYYFKTKAELLVLALRHMGDRIEERIRAASDEHDSALGALRAALVEMLPLDNARRQEALVWLAFVGRAGVEPALTDAAEQVWRSVNDPLAARLRDAVQRGELPADLDVECATLALQALVDGLIVHLATTPRLVPPGHALTVVDERLAMLAAPPAERPATSRHRQAPVPGKTRS